MPTLPDYLRVSRYRLNVPLFCMSHRISWTICKKGKFFCSDTFLLMFGFWGDFEYLMHFLRLTLVENTIRHFIEMKVTENVCSKQQVSDKDDPIRIVLLFKDEKSVNAVRYQLGYLSWKIDAVVQPVHTSQKIKGQCKPKEHKPPIVNQQNIVFIITNVICAIRTMSASQVDTYINVWRNISDQQSATT